MVNDLHLKGNELLCYAIIHGFSQDGESQFTGSLQYLADWCNTSKQTIITALQSLCEKKLILKNVEYKNNLKFCTYKTSMVVKNFEQGSQNSLMGYSKNLNGGSQNFLPNNIYNKLDNNINDTQDCVPSYIKQKEIIPKKEDVKIVEEIYNLLNDFNRSTPKHKIPISKGLFNFQCKEGREVLHLMEQDCSENIVQALKNYLIVANMDSWKTSFSFNAFCKSYAEYTTEFFDITKYDKETDADAICDNFIKLMESRYPKEFDTGAFWQHRADWLQKGRPQDKKYFEWQNEIYKIMD
jgi:hypothetical protein